MSSRKDDIRAAIVTALTGATSAGSRVFDSREVDLGEGELPAITVHTGDEDSEKLCPTPSTYKRTLPVEVQAYVKGLQDEGTVKAALDALASSIEAILDGEDADGILTDLELTGAPERVAVEGQTYCSVILKFEALYFT